MGIVTVKWIESQLMTSVDSFGHPLVMGSWPEQEPEWAIRLSEDKYCSVVNTLKATVEITSDFEMVE